MAQDTVTLVNRDRSRGKFLAELPHDIVCMRTGACACAKRQVLTPAGKHRTLRTPASFTVFVGGETEVPAIALGLDPVKRAIAQGWLHVLGGDRGRDAGVSRLLPSVSSTPSSRQRPIAQAVAFAVASEPNLPDRVKAAVAEGAEKLKSAVKKSK